MAEKVEIGLIGGQVVSARLEEEALRTLRGALDSGAGWHDVAAEDGQLSLDLAKVAYLRLDSGEHRVGFITDG